MSRTLAHVVCGALAALAACSAPPPPAGRVPSDATPSATAAPAAAVAVPELLAGMGTHHHPIRTTSREAQAWFDQGMTLAFGFNHEEAVRSFARAAQLDPSAAMPHWGIAWALGPNYNLDVDDPRATQANAAVLTAQALAADGPPSERDYVATLAGRYAVGPPADRAAIARRYSGTMRRLAARYPDDLDAATLYAESLMNLRPWKLWSLDGRPAADTLQIMSVLESVLRRDPNHVGANHYYIHTVEASPKPDLGLASAQRLERLVPAAGHLVHMPAHIYARTGDHAGAARANQAGADADRAYLARAPRGGFYEMAYYAHNLHFLADSHMMQGRLAEARSAAAAVADALAPHLDMMPMAESMAATPLSVLLRFGRHDELLAVPAPSPTRPVLTAWWHFARGVALARTGDADAAAAAREALSTAAAAVPDAALFGGTGLTTARDILALATTVLDARIAAARGRQQDAVALWRQAVAHGDRVPYDEPPIWFYPLRESLGAALLAAGDAAAAERVFRDDLSRVPRNPRSLLGLRESLIHQQKDTGWVQRAFDAAAANADPPISLDGF